MHHFSRKFIDFELTNSFTSLAVDYLSSTEQLVPFQSFPFSMEGFEEAIRNGRKSIVQRELLAGILSEQLLHFTGKSSSGKTEENIASLKKDTTFTVTTGHQLNLFTGPVYFIYKIISTINLSVALKKNFPKYDFVPVYWMASEDHDLDEINHIHLFGKKVEWKPQSAGAAGRIGSMGIGETIVILREMLGHNPGTEHLLELFIKAYDEKNNLAEATSIIVHQLFSDYGLVVLNADDVRLKRLFVDEMKDDVANHSAFKLVGETIESLEVNYKAQVHPREINLFYLGEHIRERIVEADGSYKVLNTQLSFSKEELLQQIEKQPQLFSPNVVLRPLYQEKVLPNLAYIGGPAEISYWLEYKKMFEHYKMQLPVLVLRNCVMVIDSGSHNKLKKLGFSAEDIFLSEDDLVKKFLKQNSADEFSMEELLNQTDALFKDVINRVNDVDPTLKASAEAEKQKVLNSLKSLEERTLRAQKKKHETAVSQIRKLKEKFFPENKLQERHENILSFYSKYGDDFIKALMQNLDPMEKKFILLIEE